MTNQIDNDHVNATAISRAELQGSFLTFTRVYFKFRTGRDFTLTRPMSRESHIVTMAKLMTQFVRGTLPGGKRNLLINIPPRYGKTELAIHLVAWTLCRYPDSNYMYVSFSGELATKATSLIRDIITLPTYRDLFEIQLRQDSASKSSFMTTEGGCIEGVGAGGTVTGKGAGIHKCDRFGGFIAIDDIIKPDEALSDVIRDGRTNWYYNTLISRRNDGEKTPMLYIGQRTHEAELCQKLIDSGEWYVLVIPALDEHNNALDPERHSTSALLRMKEDEPYVFSAQWMQEPSPPGGSVFKRRWFVLHDVMPDILATFITADTAETEKTYNDATVFSLWGLYKIKQFGHVTNSFALHWLNCVEIRVQPEALRGAFKDFYVDALKYAVKPSLVAIEKKSTGTALISYLNTIQGINVIDINRTAASGSKAARFIQTQPYVSQGLISLPINGLHTEMCLTHCEKITPNMAHAHDDIADTMADAVTLTFMDKIVEQFLINATLNKSATVLEAMAQSYNDAERAWSA
jgi:predicted phage terminase large subunit-like protein